MNAAHPHFNLIASTPIESLNLVLEEYKHKDTGAVHFHMANESAENVFLIGLRTVPQDSTGVAHILEHTSLCGSEKYPVRDPFFMMIRRSLNTFMNAFTSSDWTAYPFASQSRKDFENLRAVYLDAVFFARLDRLDFAQEGCRIELEDADNPDSDLVYKGVVFNEMKGAMSSIGSQLWQAVGESLFPDTTYGHNSGGDPAAITDLSYEDLLAFYKTHYHPDNAIFMTFGDIPAADHQQAIQELALSRFSGEGIHIEVPMQTPPTTPLRHALPYAFASQTDESDPAAASNSHHVLAWVLDAIRDPLKVMQAHLLAAILMENSASPLQKALETSPLGKAPSPLCGVDDSGLQMLFVCGLEGCSADSAADVEAMVLQTLRETASQPPSQQQLESLLDQLELQQREITGDGFPYGLQIMMSCIGTAMHRGKVSQALDLDPVIDELRSQIKEPDFVARLINRLLLDNNHRTTVSLTPDPELASAQLAQEADKLAAIKSELSNDDIRQINQTAADLEARQAKVDDPDILPKVGLADVPDPAQPPSSTQTDYAFGKGSFYPQGTNGIVYHQIIAQLPELDEAAAEKLEMLNRLAPQVGVGTRDYLSTQNWQSEVSGGISSYASYRSVLEDEQSVQGMQVYSAKGLSRRSDDIIQLLLETRQDVKFTEHKRIAELIAQSNAAAQRSITGRGHGLAMSCAAQGMSPIARLSHASSGLGGIKALQALDDSFKEAARLEQFCAELTQLHEQLRSTPFDVLSIGEERERFSIGEKLETIALNSQTPGTAINWAPVREQNRQIWVCNSQVNFCARAYPTVSSGHADTAALTVLGGVLRNGYLHTAIREQGGAYGGGASQDNATGCFKFYSYRDPRMIETLDDFDASIRWLLDTPPPPEKVEEAILGVVGSIDKPSSPAGRAKQHHHDLFFGRTPEVLNAFRQSVLEVSSADLIRVAERYLTPEKASTAVVSHRDEQPQIQELAERDSMEVINL